MIISNSKLIFALAIFAAFLPAFFVFAETSVTQVTVYSTPAPSSLAFGEVSTSSVSLTWDEVAGATAYRIYVNDVLSSQVSATSHIISSLSPATLYSFRVSSLDAGSIESALSAAISTTTQSLPYTPPPTPTSTPTGSSYVPAPGQSVPMQIGAVSSFKITYSGATGSIPVRDVILKIEAPGATHMQTSNDLSFKNAKWVKFQPEFEWKLSEGPGTKVVYLRLQSQKEVIRSIYVDSEFKEQPRFDLNDLLDALRKNLRHQASDYSTTSRLMRYFAPTASSSYETEIRQAPVKNINSLELQKGASQEKETVKPDSSFSTTSQTKASSENVGVPPKTLIISLLLVIAAILAITIIF
jgi:hypothetical protein